MWRSNHFSRGVSIITAILVTSIAGCASTESSASFDRLQKQAQAEATQPSPEGTERSSIPGVSILEQSKQSPQGMDKELLPLPSLVRTGENTELVVSGSLLAPIEYLAYFDKTLSQGLSYPIPILGAELLPQGTYTIKVTAPSGKRETLFEQLAIAYQQIFQVSLVRETRDLPVFILAQDAARMTQELPLSSTGSNRYSCNYAGCNYEGDMAFFADELGLGKEKIVVDETGLQGYLKLNFGIAAGETPVQALEKALRESGILLNPGSRPVEAVFIERVQ